ncbi:hypothetical protein ECPA31_2831, partial [Escherichia coli PA31]
MSSPDFSQTPAVPHRTPVYPSGEVKTLQPP